MRISRQFLYKRLFYFTCVSSMKHSIYHVFVSYYLTQVKVPNWNLKHSSISFQFTSLSTITYVIVDPHTLNWNKLVNWNNLKDDDQFQLRALLVFIMLIFYSK